MEFDVLGSLEVRDGGRPLAIGGLQQQRLLGVLLAHAGTVVPVDRLVDALWDAGPPLDASQTVRTYVARLRRAIGESLVVTTGVGYRLDIGTHRVDANEFVDLVDQAGRADPLAGLECLDRALALWRGGAYQQFVDEWWARGEVARLEELRLRAMERRFEYLFELDRHADTVADLQRAVVEQPLRQRLVGLLMVALSATGREAEAHRAFAQLRTRLGAELGLDPTAELVELDRSLAQSGVLPSAPAGIVSIIFAETDDVALSWSAAPTVLTSILGRVDDVLRAAVTAGRGVVFTTTVRGLGAAFSTPAGAVSAAIAAQQAIGAQRWPADVEIAIRVGVAIGEASAHNGSYIGAPVECAAQIARITHRGQILVTSAVAALVDVPGVDLVDMGERRLTGGVRPERLHRVRTGGLVDVDWPLTDDGFFGGNLPRQVGELIGRQRELVEVGDLVVPGRLVTLTGPGGVGKTSLALAVAASQRARYADGGWLVELAAVSDREEVGQVVVEQLGLMIAEARPGVAAIADSLGGQRRLIVLDNCEHVVGVVSAVAAAILRRCPNVALVATSREPLGASDETQVAVPPLSLEAGHTTSHAAMLFIERASRVVARFAPADDERALIEQICIGVDGLPLAVELAAARIGSLGLHELHARVPARLDVLDRRRGEPRHRGLAATVAWSYDLLSADERVVFERLSVFADGFDLAAAVAVCAGPPTTSPVEAVMASLVEQSLVTTVWRAGLRYRQLEVVRQFAAARLAERGDAAAVERRLIDHYVDWTVTADDGCRGPDEQAWGQRFDIEWGNIRDAFHRSVSTADLDAASAIVWRTFWWASQRARQEIGDWADGVLAMPGADLHPQHAIILAVAADTARRRVEWPAYGAILDRGAAHERDREPAAEPWLPFASLQRDILISTDDPPAVARQVHARANGSPFWEALAAWCDSFMLAVRLSHAAPDRHDPGDMARIDRCAALAEATANPTLLAQALNLTAATYRQHDRPTAIRLLERSLALATSVGNESVVAFDRWDLAILLAESGQYADAVAVLVHAIDHYRRAAATFQAWDMCQASLRVLVATGANHEACAIVGRHTNTPLTDDWLQELLPDRDRAQLEANLGTDAMQDLVTEGATTSISVIIDNVHRVLRDLAGAPQTAPKPPAADGDGTDNGEPNAGTAVGTSPRRSLDHHNGARAAARQKPDDRQH